jgi:site-specific recombinase XerD
MGECVRRLFEQAGIRLPAGAKHKLHLLRGTYATNCLRGGADLESLRVNLGHSDLKVTAVYLAATDESRRQSIQGLDDLWN